MWIHPDSMVSGGLRFLENGPVDFNFGTYGPTAYLFAGMLTVTLYPLGVILGFWNSLESFELAYRTNEAGQYTFTQFSIICNVILILTSLVLLAYTLKFRMSFVHGLALFPILLLSIPITLFQLSLDTIEPLVFFGITYCLFVSYFQFQRNRKLLKFDYFFIATAFVLTIGIRPNLALFTIPIFLYVSHTKCKNNSDSKEYYPMLWGCLLTFLTYMPILIQFQVLASYVTLIRRLAGLSFEFDTVSRNLEIVLLNVGPYFMLSSLLLCIIFAFIRLNPFNRLDQIWLILGTLYLLLFIFNGNGFPKYLVPLVPIASFLFLSAASHVKFEHLNFRNFFVGTKNTVLFSTIIISIIVAMLMGQINFNSQQAKSSFDTRALLKEILPTGSEWMKDALANQSVIAELTRGNEPYLFDDIKKFLGAIESKAVTCKELVILSSRDIEKAGIEKTKVTCSTKFSDYETIRLMPYTIDVEIKDDTQWLGLLSLGTPEDKTRIALGPNYTLLVRKSWDQSSSILFACRKSVGCSIG